ncbi:MAG: DUF1015 domain-containing protein [Deltaproteobacteria bacterium]|nr:DUF1015 domain-containing protein [Deltaproteobacteria bacterium]
MSIIKPFRGFRPIREKVASVASPPYDVLNSEEARKMAGDNPLSFLHVVKPEIGLDPSVNLYSDEVYAKGAENLARLKDTGTLVQDETPCLYLYEQQMLIGDKQHVQVGLVAGTSIDEYQNDLIKKHELTRPDKEKDRTRHVNTQNANSGPVFLTYEADVKINAIIEKACQAEPVYNFTADDGIGHRFWVVSDDETIQALVEGFAATPHLYVADGHHRSASGSNVREIRKAANPNHTGEEGYNFFLAVIFPHDQMYIMDYNRVVFDLAGLSDEAFLKKVQEKFEVEKTTEASPDRATEFGMYLSGTWYRLRAKAGTFDPSDPVDSLDIAILQNNLLSPILGIDDPRRDKRIDFVGGIRGMAELERRVNEGGAVSFAMYPTSIEQLMAIADAGKIMPPKSTWFEPKLRSGLVVRSLD